MIEGKVVTIPFDRYAMPRFKVSLKHKAVPYNTCGSGTLSMLTGVNPQSIDECRPWGQAHWSSHAMKNHLRCHGWKVVPITINAVGNVDWERFPLNDNHLLLLNLHMNLTEASWLVAHKGLVYHNFGVVPFTGLYLVNKPIQECFLLHKG